MKKKRGKKKSRKLGERAASIDTWKQATTAVKAGRMLARQQRASNLPEAGT